MSLQNNEAVQSVRMSNKAMSSSRISWTNTLSSIVSTHPQSRQIVDLILLGLQSGESIATLETQITILKARVADTVENSDAKEVEATIDACLSNTRQEAKTLLDGKAPITFNRIIEHELAEYPGSTWYVADFEFDVPAHGTTESSHHVLIRTQSPLANTGEDLLLEKLIDEFKNTTPFARIHSSCRDGDLPMPTARCDCGIQFQSAVNGIETRKQGLLIYLNQDGRGFGNTAKSKALELEDGRKLGKWIGPQDPDSALEGRHGSADKRNFTVAAKVLHAMGISAVELHTSNRKKLGDLKSNNIQVNQISSAGEATNDVLLVEHLTKMRSGRYQDMGYKAVRKQLELRLNDIAQNQTINAALLHLLDKILGDILTGHASQYPTKLVGIITQNQRDILRAKSNGH